MSRLAHPAPSSSEGGILTHSRIWDALDALASGHGMSPSGLAKKAGLDATTFNRSKRRTADGRLRWPSTESIAKVLDATGASLAELFVLMSGTQGERALRLLPLTNMERMKSDPDLFTSTGEPSGKGWGETPPPPSLAGEGTFVVEIAGDDLSPIFRNGDLVYISPRAEIRPGDRILAKARGAAPFFAEFRRQSGGRVEWRGLGAGAGERTIHPGEVEWLARIIWCSQ